MIATTLKMLQYVTKWTDECSMSPQIHLRILLVDDEDMVREVSKLMLEAIGHEVDDFANPNQALANFMSRPELYDLAIIDMIMPEMTGKDLFKELRKIRPDIKVAISSGYQMDETNESLLALGVMGFINKPFNMDILEKKLAEFAAS